ncbi:protein 60A-like [Cotesia glomerata]|uniref:protein 60A-like n=1 Tax=Cotesia glomerata TaxID=32391 RepID=UPI001D00BD5D|nr:protein 60A-like [Cotesia glomerata]
MSILRINNNTYYLKLIVCVCTFILFDLTNNYNVVSISEIRNRDIGVDDSNSNKNEVYDNSTESLSHLLKKEIKSLFQDLLTGIPIAHNQVRKYSSRFDGHELLHHEPLQHTSAIHFLKCLQRKNERNDDLDDPILSKDDEYAYNNTDMIISVLGDEAGIPDDIIEHNDKEGGENMYFNVSKVRKDRVAQFGSLRLFKDNDYPLFWDNSMSVSIELYEIKKIKFNTSLDFITKTNVKRDYKGWIVLKITELFQKWSWHPEKNYGVHLDVVVEHNFGDKKFYKLSDIGVIDIEATDKKELQPFAVGFFQMVNTLNDQDPEKKKRSRRDLTQMILEKSYRPPKVRKDVESNFECKVRKFQFFFADFGWDDFIIAPSFFDLSYCHGSCSISRINNSHLPMHSYLQRLAHDMYPSSIPIPCCAPIKFDSLNLMYYGHNNNILLEKLKQISTTQCECL